MLNKFITLLKLFVLLTLIILTAVYFGRDFITPQEGIFYTVKRIEEKITLAIQTSPQKKSEYLSQLLDNRLKELVLLADIANKKNLVSASLRYYTTAGELVDFVKTNKLDSEIPKIKSQLQKHKSYLIKILNDYKDVDKAGELRWIQDDINYLNLSLEKI